MENFTHYPAIPRFDLIVEEIEAILKLKAEYGAEGLPALVKEAEIALCHLREKIAAAPIDPGQEEKEPNDLACIRQLRSAGPRRIWRQFNPDSYRERLEGALLGRCAGCTLGAIVEGWPVAEMEAWANETGHSFPPADYWPASKDPSKKRYGVSRCDAYTPIRMNGVPVDDDLIYTQLGLLLLEKHGASFTTHQIGQMWVQYLPWVWKDMDWALRRFKEGVPVEKAADGNPWEQMICAFIRCDPYGYAAAGWPELAAEMSWRDGLMSHRRNGLYGGMFFAASIAAAFTVEHPVDALQIGLTEIPSECLLAREIRWALEAGKEVRNYRDARRAVDERFGGMHGVHTINNACLAVFGLMIGGRDLTRVISETVAMGLDNDCTAATAGSIAGAVIGKKGVPEHWYRAFNDTMHSYIRDHPAFAISDMVERYGRIAHGIWNAPPSAALENVNQ